eukprot:TRINITY_DN31224_c0_g1_i1.p1 TRINITY_DN31224_c0_g1~~TRINITY_DN31224_c0_g1_i1.p1  ORF type:complete len:486 (+),score=130.64 TRINITY_DN31224_c0_g1_i1:123-1580(+)
MRQWSKWAAVASFLSAVVAANEGRLASELLRPAAARRLVQATARVVAAAGAFGKLRSSLSEEPETALEALKSALDSDDLALLEGRCATSRALEERLQQLQARADELRPVLHSLLPDADDWKAATAPGTADGEDASKALDFDVAGYSEDLERLAGDLEGHFIRSRGLAFAKLPTPEPNAVPQGVRQQTAVSVGSAGLAVDTSAAVEHVGQLSRLAAELADAGPLAAARRLSARLARLGGSDADEATQAEAADISREALAEVARAEQLLRTQHQQEPEQVPQAEARGSAEPAGSPNAIAAAVAAAGCTVPAIEGLAVRFEEAMKGFRKKAVQQVMLPPEVENLQRVVHTLEVLKSSLLFELKSGKPFEKSAVGLSSEEIRARAEPTVRECARYQSGVTQLESDLAHYKELAAQQRQARTKSGKGSAGSTDGVATPSQGRDSAALPPPAPPPPRRKLEPLSFDALGTTGSRFAGGLGGAGVLSQPPVR